MTAQVIVSHDKYHFFKRLSLINLALKNDMQFVDKIVRELKLETQSHLNDEYVFQENEPFHGIYYLKKGQIKMLRNLHGKKMLAWFADAGDFIGISSFFNESPSYIYSAQAHAEICETQFIPESQFKYLLEEYPKLREEMIQVFCSRIAFMEERILKHKNENINTRLVDALLYLSKKSQIKNLPVSHHFTITDLSELIGSTQANVKRLLHNLERKQLLKIENQIITISNLSHLEKMMSF